MRKTQFLLLLCVSAAWGQTGAPADAALQRYLGAMAASAAAWDKLAPGTRPYNDPTRISLDELSPLRRPYAFVAYILDTHLDRSAAAVNLAQQVAVTVAQGQMNKMLGGTVKNSGTTSLLSSSVAADVLSVATEYGAVAQASAGDAVTFRANLLGVAGLLAGDPYLGCPSQAAGGCSPASRWLRGFSTSLSLQTASGGDPVTATGANAATGAPATAALPSGANRMSAWGARFDWFRKTLYDLSPLADLEANWAQQMALVSSSPVEAELDAAVVGLMNGSGYAAWHGPFIEALQQAPPGQMNMALKGQLDSLISLMASQDAQFMAKVQRARDAIIASFVQRDEILRDLQSNKFATEFTSQHPLGQPNLSNVRLIYSYQPGKASQLFTVNAAAEWYDAVPAGVKVGKLRDLQAAAQLDRQLGAIPRLGPAKLTLAYYYQWMKEDALLTIPSGNNAPGTSIALPGAASTLLAPRGSIDIFQAKVTIPIKDGLVSVPVSFTWSNRTELINESEKRGQIGLTVDLDSLFRK